jgi:glycine/D-amino acid oxidase-like deaminating enzyme
MGKEIAVSLKLPLDERFDAIVAGGGPAGCTAAAAAARAGAKTLLLEASGVLGGMGTSGLVPAWCPFSDKDRIVYGGGVFAVDRLIMKKRLP